MDSSDFERLTHEDLAVLAQDGDNWATEYLIRQYTDKVRERALQYFMIGAEKEDVVQEGMIGLFKAIKNYDPNKKASFATFATVCIDRQIMTAVRAAARKKHSPLNTSISIYEADDGERNFEEMISGGDTEDPPAIAAIKEMLERMVKNDAGIFSSMEMQVCREYINGKSYDEIAKDLEKTPKSVYNAMERVRKKITAYMAE